MNFQKYSLSLIWELVVGKRAHKYSERMKTFQPKGGWGRLRHANKCLWGRIESIFMLLWRWVFWANFTGTWVKEQSWNVKDDCLIVLICIFLMISSIERFCMSSATCMPSLKKYLCRSFAHFLIGLFALLVLSCVELSWCKVFIYFGN